MELTIILLPLIPIHRRHSPRHPKEHFAPTPMPQDIPNQRPLPRIRRQYGNPLRRIPQQPHIHVNRHRILRLPQVLNEMRCRFHNAFTLVVRHLDELELVSEAGIGELEFDGLQDDGEVVEFGIPPFVEFC